MGKIDVKKLLSEMTLEEKAGLCSGADFWHTKEVKRLGLPPVMVSDGPHGLRKVNTVQDVIGESESVKAVCFPTSAALACSFDRDLIGSLGQALGEECQAEQVSTLLGPGVNMKRSPLCGRNFEYYSEDPYLAGELAAGFVKGVQSKNVGTSLKHFAVNNQETRRMSVSSEVDERTLREIYLTAFETVVKKAKPWTLMCSYNCVNGTYSCENDWLLNQVLRKEWGFEGLVMSDWGAMNNRVKALKAGLDLEMPSSKGITDKEIVKAVEDGSLSMEVLDTAVMRILEFVRKHEEGKKDNSTYSLEEHHKLARHIAGECAVLLKNEDHILPIKKDMEVAFIGEFAADPRIQGGGSSHINCFKVTNALEAAKGYDVSYARGYDVMKDEADEALIKEAAALAKSVQAAVIFAGLPDRYESEGYDRTHLNLPDGQNNLIEEIAKIQPNTIVVLHNGAPVLLPWINKVKGILELGLCGQAAGEASVDLLYGDVNPSGKLAETYPMRLQDNPSYINFPGTRRQVEYKEGIFIGYRYYDAKEMEVLFPFGHGLSYTNFEYSSLKLQVIRDGSEISPLKEGIRMKDTDQLHVSLKVKNTGKCSGREIIQLYVHDKEASVLRPPKELKGFEKVELAPGEEKTVSFILDKRSFAFYSTQYQDWYAESGDFDILVGKSSRDICLSETITLESSIKPQFVIDDRTTFGDVLAQFEDPSKFKYMIMTSFGGDASQSSNVEEGMKLLEGMKDTPLHSIKSFAPAVISDDSLKNMIMQHLEK